jgi:hypothetical protein
MASADEMTVQGLAECLEWPITSAAVFWSWAKESPKPEMQALVRATDRLLAIVNGMPDRPRVEKLWRHHQYKYLTPKALALGHVRRGAVGPYHGHTSTRFGVGRYRQSWTMEESIMYKGE